MADLITTIKVNSSQFDNSIKGSTNQIRKFDAEAKKISGSVSGFEGKLSGAALGGVAKLAGALGVAFTATESFKGVIQSTQATSDAFDIKMQQTKSAVDYFFTSIANGNWSNFWEGLDGAIARGEKLAITMDNLGDVIAGYTVAEFDLKNTIQDNINVINDPSSTSIQITEATRLAEEAQKELSRITEERVLPSFRDAVRDSFSEAAKADSITDEDIDFYYKIQLKDDEGFKEFNEERDRLEKLSKETIQVVSPKGGTIRSRTEASYVAEAELKTYKEQNLELERAWKINNNIVDKKRDGITATILQGKQAERNLIQAERLLNRARRSAATRGSKSTGRSEVEDQILPEGSIANLEKRIADLNKQIKLETDPVTYKALYEQIEKLKKEVVYIQVMYKTTFDPKEKVGQSIKPLSVQSKYIKDNKLDVSNVSITTPDLSENVTWFDTYRSALNLVRQDNEGVLESFDAISGSLSAIGNASDGSAAAMLRWFASTVGSIGQAIPVIQALIVAKKAEATANAEAAATGAAASVAGIPVVGALLAAGAVATVLASFASIPKFADGGIVYGNTIAQVGEYAGASNNPEVIAPLSKLRKILAEDNVGGSSSVDFRIAGKDLVGVINNYSFKNNKK